MTTRRWRGTAALAALVAAQGAIGFDNLLLGKIAPLVAESMGAPLVGLSSVFVAHHAGLAVGATAGGLLGDRLGRRVVLIACVILAAVMTLATPLARSVLELAVVRATVGLLLGMAAPCVLALVTGHVDGRWRGLAVTTTLAANSVGAATGSIFAMSLTRTPDWGHGFTLSGVLLLGLAIPLLAWPADGPTRGGGRGDPAAEPLDRAFWRTATAVAVCFAISMGLIATLSAWQASYFHHFAAVPVQRFARVSLLSAPGAILGMMAIGAAASRAARSWLIALIFGAHAAALLLIGNVAFGAPAFAGVFLVSVMAQAAGQGLLNITVAEVCPSAIRASAYGCFGAIGRAGGILAPWIAARLLETHLSLAGVFALLAMAPLAVGAILLGVRRPAEGPFPGRGDRL